MTDHFQGFANRIVSQFSSRYSPVGNIHMTSRKKLKYFLVEELLRWQVRGDPNFNPAEVPFHEKAVKALVRKLKRGKEKGSSQV